MQCRSSPEGPPSRCLDPTISLSAGCGGQDIKDPYSINLRSARRPWCGTRAAGPQWRSRRSPLPVRSSAVWHPPSPRRTECGTGRLVWLMQGARKVVNHCSYYGHANEDSSPKWPLVRCNETRLALGHLCNPWRPLDRPERFTATHPPTIGQKEWGRG